MINSKITYTEKLDYYVRTQNLIPYRLHPRARYRNHCFYWIANEDKWFRIEEVEYSFADRSNPILDHIIVTWMDRLQGYICTDLCIYDFRLEKDKFCIRDLETLINTDDSYTGAEIEYWFYIHDIDFHDDKYSEFWKYLSRDSDCRIEASKYYYIYAKEIDGTYTDIIFELDPIKRKFKPDNKLHYNRS